MAGISLQINIKGERNLLRDQRNRLGPPARLYPVTKDFGERMIFSIEENFRTGGRPVSWTPSKKAEGMTLIVTARLKNSIAYRATPDSLTVGTNVIYARIHQLGGMAGRGRKTKIPARPFLVVQESDLAYLRRSLQEFLTGD